MHDSPFIALGKKGDLLELARKKVHEGGYVYKKGHSHSKVVDPIEDGAPMPKSKVNATERQRRINELNEEISDLNRPLKIKEPQIAQATSSRNFKVCDELAHELQELNGCWWQLNYELSDLQKKCKKAREYLVRKEKTVL